LLEFGLDFLHAALALGGKNHQKRPADESGAEDVDGELDAKESARSGGAVE
jgi:hypothetical protein